MATLATPEALTTTDLPKRTYLQKAQGILSTPLFHHKGIDTVCAYTIGNRAFLPMLTTNLAAAEVAILYGSLFFGAMGAALNLFAVGTTLRVMRTTGHNYVRAQESIAKEGTLDERVAYTVIENPYRTEGYCEQQGLYLAARDSDNPEANLKVFFDTKRKHSKNIIPNF